MTGEEKQNNLIELTHTKRFNFASQLLTTDQQGLLNLQIYVRLSPKAAKNVKLQIKSTVNNQ